MKPLEINKFKRRFIDPHTQALMLRGAKNLS